MIRAAVAGDGAAIAAIWNPVIRETEATFNSVEKSPAEIAAMIAARPSFLVAEEAGALLGFASYGQFRGGVGYARTMEHTVILPPAAQGRGVGRALMAALEAEARGQGVRSLIAGVSGTNAGALRFHAALGFQEVGVVREAGWKFGRALDLHLLQKML